ncbi:MAG TPA: hypothetical protein VLH56_03525, partial [Dissulfurispiraceae bacterium]|nr:hypothetical protein [Dissulfurispiraceae bacterium]
ACICSARRSFNILTAAEGARRIEESRRYACSGDEHTLPHLGEIGQWVTKSVGKIIYVSPAKALKPPKWVDIHGTRYAQHAHWALLWATNSPD